MDVSSDSLANNKNAGEDNNLWRQSASTWLHSSPQHKFPKAKRFQFGSKTSSGEFYIQPSTLSSRSTSLGFWKKTMMPEGMLKYASQVPGPGHYKSKNQFEEGIAKNKGKNLGLSYTFYRRTYYPNMKDSPEPEMFRFNPGPDAYNVDKPIGKDKKSMSIHLKGKGFQDYLKNETPPCNMYNPSFVLSENSRYKKINMGFGKKMDFSKALNNNPGPGAYNLPSIFDRKKRKTLERIM